MFVNILCIRRKNENDKAHKWKLVDSARRDRARFQVPVLVLAAQRDRYMNCCVIETAQAMDAAAKQNGKKFELVVYPEANHGFNLQTGASGEPGAYRHDDNRDAWLRTVEMLKLYPPLPSGKAG